VEGFWRLIVWAVVCALFAAWSESAAVAFVIASFFSWLTLSLLKASAERRERAVRRGR
jgi:hypothetical protein